LGVPRTAKLQKGIACVALENCKWTYNSKKDTGVLVTNKGHCKFSVVKKINRYAVYGFILVSIVKSHLKRPNALSIFLA